MSFRLSFFIHSDFSLGAIPAFATRFFIYGGAAKPRRHK
jgi:hypothetical protein